MVLGAGTGTGSLAVSERIARYQHAAEVLRARTVLVISCSLWFVVGATLDLTMFGALGHGSLAFVLGVRVASSVFHATVIALLFRRPPPPPRIAVALIAAVFPVTGLALTVMASQVGGLASPYVVALFIGIMVEAIGYPGPWRRGTPIVVATVAIYPIGMLIATRLDPVVAAQLHDDRALAVFITHVSVLFAGAIVVAWGGHVIWSLRQSVFESRNIGRYRLARRIGKGGMGEGVARDRSARSAARSRSRS